MQAITFGGIEKIIHQSVPDPVIVDPTDVIVKITMAVICGFDMDKYHVRDKCLGDTILNIEFSGYSDINSFHL